jgi:DNA-binding transcriptional regulator YbjK
VTDRRARIDCRLVDAVTRVAATDGVAALTVERVLLVAGVSRASFYQYFRSVEECFFPGAVQAVEGVVSLVLGIMPAHVREPKTDETWV